MDESSAMIRLHQWIGAIARAVTGYVPRTVGKHWARKLTASVPDSTYQNGVSILTKGGQLNHELYGTYT